MGVKGVKKASKFGEQMTDTRERQFMREGKEGHTSIPA